MEKTFTIKYKICGDKIPQKIRFETNCGAKSFKAIKNNGGCLVTNLLLHIQYIRKARETRSLANFTITGLNDQDHILKPEAIHDVCARCIHRVK